MYKFKINRLQFLRVNTMDSSKKKNTSFAKCFREITVFTINLLSYYTATACLKRTCNCNPYNRPFSSYFKPHYESEDKCKASIKL